ncbi:N-acetylmuramoyl-L-alanine amidase [Candidatus Parcubacteria bacterium]|nr:N-acetylmuramoyl-L-alanine amidase [Candidatus Parcubacteria bacterium]
MKAIGFFLMLNFIFPSSFIEDVKIERVSENSSLRIQDNYSGRNSSRAFRPVTKYIVLHTTECSSDQSSLNGVRPKGKCNYLVRKDGLVYRIIDKNKISTHAGVSVWDGVYGLNENAIGIEVVGSYLKPITYAQKVALKELIRQLQSIYNLDDTKVVTHSMVAYSKPNKYHSVPVRGRKRCGSQFAGSELRSQLGLSNTFAYDPDMKAGRVKYQADPYLNRLYTGSAAWTKGSSIKVKTEDDHIEADGFREIPKDGKTAWAIAGVENNISTTIYFFPDGRVETGNNLDKSQLESLPTGTKVLVGYIYGGKIKKGRTAYKVVGRKWNYPSTFYRKPDGTILSGDGVSEKEIPSGSIVFFQKWSS